MMDWILIEKSPLKHTISVVKIVKVLGYVVEVEETEFLRIQNDKET
jgi:hypothetical protein